MGVASSRIPTILNRSVGGCASTSRSKALQLSSQPSISALSRGADELEKPGVAREYAIIANLALDDTQQELLSLK
eukprot:IDg9773t1